MTARTADTEGDVMIVARRGLQVVRDNLRVEGPQLVRIVVAVAVSWQVCLWLGAVHPPVYAAVVPLVALRDAPGSAFNLSVARLVGVVGGLALGMAVLSWLRPSAAAVALVMALALAAGIVLRVGGALNVQVAASALLVFASTDPSSYALSRLWETAVGAAVTIVLSPLLLPTNPAREFSRALHAVAVGSGENLVLASGLLSTGRAGHDDRAPGLSAAVDTLDGQARALPARLVAAQRAVRRNPVWRRHGAELDELVGPTGVAPEVTALVRTHVADVVELSARPDVRDRLSSTAPLTRAVVLPLAAAVAAGLAGEPDAAALAEATSALEAHRTADPTALGAVVRRPLHRIIVLLAGLAGSADTP